MGKNPYELSPAQAYRQCDLSALSIESSDQLESCEEFVGQDRAISAINFGLGVSHCGYNIFLSGPPGVGKSSSIKRILNEVAGTKTTPGDWCYVYNFLDPNAPKALSLPTGHGKVFKKDMGDLVETLQREIPKAFESKDYEQEQQRLQSEAQTSKTELFDKLQKTATEKEFQLQFSPTGVVTLPLHKGKPLTQEEYSKLTDEEKAGINKRKDEMEEQVAAAYKIARKVDREVAAKVKELERRVALFAVSDLLDNIREKYNQYPEIIDYLHHVQRHILENIDKFRHDKDQAPPPGAPPMPFVQPVEPPSFTEYKVNVFIDNSNTEGAPVVFETHPIYSNLFGTIERVARFGMFTTDFTLIRPGSLPKANGGYLVVEALDILKAPFVWDSLKKTLENQELGVEDVFQQYGFTSTVGLRPEPIKVDIKVIMIGNPSIYHLLYTYDEDFRKLFKVKADYDTVVERTPETENKYACLLKHMSELHNLKPLTRSGLEAVIEHSSRMAADQGKLSVMHGSISKLMHEAHYLASSDGNADYISREHVARAIEQKIFRSNMIEEKLQELIQQGSILIDSDGRAVGQINGVAVYDLGDYAFGKPARITCETYMGMEGLVNIERRAKMSGSIHDKGVLILGGYLGAQYAGDKPLSVSATLAFEQSYSMIEGDSASAAELIALLSSLSGLEIRQDIAITGSVDQKGNIQPIGGVNEKTEGFFKCCEARGLSGKHGMVIPHQNVRNLMLSSTVRESIEKGKFHIYPVTSIDDVIEIMMDKPAGKRGKSGKFPRGTVHYLVDKRLGKLTEGFKKLTKGAEGQSEKKAAANNGEENEE